MHQKWVSFTLCLATTLDNKSRFVPRLNREVDRRSSNIKYIDSFIDGSEPCDSVSRELNLITIVWNWYWYCSCEKVLWAIGALVIVNRFRLTGRWAKSGLGVVLSNFVLLLLI